MTTNQAYQNALGAWEGTWTAPEIGYLAQGLDPQETVNVFTDYWRGQGISEADLQRDVTGVLTNVGVYGGDSGGSVLGASTGSSGGGSAASSGPNTAEELAYLDDQSSELDRLLGRTDKTLTQGRKKIESGYKEARDDANADKARQLSVFNTQDEDNQRDRQSAYGAVDTGARVLRNSIQKILGLAGATNSSAATVAAPGAIARDASGKRSEVTENFGRNSRNIDTQRKFTIEDFTEYLSDLLTQRDDATFDLESGIETERQNINASKGQIESERARVNGGGYSAIRSAAKPYLTAISKGDTTIDSLFNKYQNPQFNTRQVSQRAPNLSEYVVDRTAINAGNQVGAPTGESAYESFLKKKQEQASY